MDVHHLHLNWKARILIQTFLWICLLRAATSANPGCDCILFLSTFDKPFGVFQSPDYPKSYHHHISNTGCLLYTFQAKKDEIVELTFTTFDVGSFNPECFGSDNVKLYQHLDKAEVNERSIPTTALCGNRRDIKTKHFSKDQFLILELSVLNSLKSDYAQAARARNPSEREDSGKSSKNETKRTGFTGTFRFIPKANLAKTDGKKVSHSTCDFQFLSGPTSSKSGKFFSPFFPAPTPSNLKCRYFFYGRYQERIKIVFETLEINQHDSSCLFSDDFIQVFDGIESVAPVISHICGKEKHLELWSTSTQLTVELSINSGRSAGGFSASYHFVSSSEFLEGEEDSLEEDILDFPPSTAVVTTPTTVTTLRPTRSYFPALYSKTHTSFFLTSITTTITSKPTFRSETFATAQRLVPTTAKPISTTPVITFSSFATKIHSVTEAQTTPLITRTSTTTAQPTSQRITTHHNSDKNVTKSWKTVLEEQSMADIDVPTASACDQTFVSDIAKNGTFTSPNYGGIYPAGLHCRYEFRGVGRQRVQIIFTDFNLYHPHEDSPEHNFPTWQQFSCEVADRIAAYVTVNGRKEKIDDYCGIIKPKELMSNGATITIDFFSLGSSKGGRGFSAKFAFVENFGITVGEQLITHPCLFRFNSTDNSRNGSFWSPNFPGFYPRSTECHYLFYGRPGEKVRITFDTFDVEGFPPCASNQQSDYVEVSNYMTVDRKMPRYCGNQDGLVLESENQFYRVSFKANDRFDSTGFYATYRFIPVAVPVSVTRRQETPNRGTTIGPHWTLSTLFVCLAAGVLSR
ncbi:suppressor of lurcher protein 1-like isoform X2 [Artemia franciscana]|uniref:suppressor of lurcher protein 1-like isoform X2 n=1 Tax=Artemia franciscana TaxID=6661 RepID=UPI0032DB7300